MLRLVWDLETDGLLDALTRIHCLVIADADTGEFFRFHNGLPKEDNEVPAGSVEDGLRWLMEADMVIGHNIVKFDLRAVRKLYPWFKLKPGCRVFDTIIAGQLLWPDIKFNDIKRAKRGFPMQLAGKHSLEAYGYRLGEYKGDYKGPWETFSKEMLDYNEQDVVVNLKLFLKIEKECLPQNVLDLEQDVADIIADQEDYGFAIDLEAAVKLYTDLVKKREELTAKLKEVFKPWWGPDGSLQPRKGKDGKEKAPKALFVPKLDSKKFGYTAGAPMTKVKLIEFNPGSRKHIASRLKALYGWQPQEFTDSGEPKIDETVMDDLPYAEAPLLMEYLLVAKLIGMLAEGDNAWLKKERKGRIHGKVWPHRAVTRRMTHSDPNMAQVPKVGSPYGKECRSLFIAPKGKVLVGADAAGLELRCLAHYLAIWDGGAYAYAVTQGSQEKGDDAHSLTALALDLQPQHIYTLNGKTGKGRDFAKTWIYAFLYGAGDWKLGATIGRSPAIGKKNKLAFIARIKGMDALKKAVAARVPQGHLLALDGSKLRVRSPHAALNTLLQGAGAVVMKKALVILDRDLTAAGYIRGRNYAFVANVHDEWQIETDEGIADDVGRRAVAAIRRAGEFFQFKCPLDGEYKVGRNWAETH